MQFSSIDTITFLLYCLVILGIGIWLATKKQGTNSAENYFLANKSLPFWVIGCSILAANISAEQFIGMSGSGYAMGLAISAYEWIAAIVLVLVAKFFLPVFIQKQIYTMPDFLAIRFDNRIKSILTVFWMVLFIFVNLTSILYLGALALCEIFNIPLFAGIVCLALFSVVYAVSGGLRTIAKIDVIQVVFLILGGLVTVYIALNQVSNGNGMFEGFRVLLEIVPEKFHLVLKKSDPNYQYMPGIRGFLGGIWIAAIYYFGANQYIIQKALGAKSLKEAQCGMVFAAFLKILTPLIVVIPGIAAFSLHAEIAKPDGAYPWLLNNFVPTGIKGLVFAALIAAIVSSLSAIVNSSSTIFTMDIYKAWINKKAGDKQMVVAGKLSGVVFMCIAVCIAPLLGNISQVFQFIQKYTGLISPAITAIFILGIFSKKTTSNAALAGIIANIPLAVILELVYPQIPFLDKMLILFIIVGAFIYVFSIFQGKLKNASKAFYHEYALFKTSFVFNISSVCILATLLIIYFVFW